MPALRTVTVALVLALVAAGCGGEGGDEAAGTGTRAERSAPGRQELRVGFSEDTYVLEGPRANLGMYPLNANVVETLAYVTPRYEVEPLLAERWEFRAPNTWRFFLRPGVTFHDGQPLNAQAVKVGLFDRVAAVGSNTIKAGPGSATVVDDLTVDFTPTEPNRRVPEQIVHPQNGVVAPGSEIGKKPVGTGPFRFVEYRPKERIVVARNPDYWGTKARLERITFRFYPDSTVRRLALESGEIDLAYQIPRPDVRALRGRGFRIENSAVGAYEAMYANIHGQPPRDLLADLNLRRALSYAIDRRALVRSVLDGLATTDQTMVPPNVLGRHASTVKGFRYDPGRARRLLEEAGWRPGPDGVRAKDGRRLELTLVSGFPSAEAHRPIPTFLQSQLKDVGIDLDIVERPDSPSYQALIQSGEGDLYLEQGNQNDANPGFIPALLFYTAPSGATADYQSLFAPGPGFDQLLAPSLTEVDPEAVKQAVAAALRHLIDEQAVVIPLAGIYRTYGMKRDVKGFVPHPSFLNVRWAGVS